MKVICTTDVTLLNKRLMAIRPRQVSLIYLRSYLTAGYREIVLRSLPQVSVLDGLNRLGNRSPQSLSSLCDIPGLEDYVDLLLSSDTSHNELVIFYAKLLSIPV